MYLQKLKSIKSRRHVRRSFDTLIAKDDNPSNKSQTLFFGIPKGTFYKKSPLAGHGAAPHENSLIAARNRRLAFRGLLPNSAVQHYSGAPMAILRVNPTWRGCAPRPFRKQINSLRKLFLVKSVEPSCCRFRNLFKRAVSKRRFKARRLDESVKGFGSGKAYQLEIAVPCICLILLH